MLTMKPVYGERAKTSYHPYILLSFYLGILPLEMLERIPASTRHDWKQRNAANLFGYEWYMQNQSSFTVMQQVFNSKKLLTINRALLRIIALKMVYGSVPGEDQRQGRFGQCSCAG